MPIKWHRCTRAWISKNTSENYDDADAMDEPGDQAGGICRLLGAAGVAAVGWVSSSSRRQSDRENHTPYRWLGTQDFIAHLGDHAAATHHRLESHHPRAAHAGTVRIFLRLSPLPHLAGVRPFLRPGHH